MSTTNLLDRLLAVTALLQADQERELGRIGLTSARTHVLWVLHHRGPSTQIQLADAIEVTPRNMTTLVDALEATGFVHRRPHPEDRRAVLVTLTERGMAVMETMAREHDDLDAALVEGLDPAIARATAEGLDHVLARLTRLVDEHLAARDELPEQPR
ncbi:MAG TPA: MarR family transcriptional regulator [Microbacterium sp.]|uniref:MarR family winged helix-turn-helix transcriptional regulator n=1 Tax=Microbacterium sp. TaxID=51671 RepID=UPI002BA7E185|nr:MarR family transcriptional regulator [Microbacterium sp.]HWI32089.1 MarR family transcriptional regulator [Microbacterium sp.]